jgi:hypothetical protein
MNYLISILKYYKTSLKKYNILKINIFIIYLK